MNPGEVICNHNSSLKVEEKLILKLEFSYTLTVLFDRGHELRCYFACLQGHLLYDFFLHLEV